MATDLETLAACEEKLEELFAELMADLAQKEATRTVTKIFVKLKFADFTRTTVERAGLAPSLGEYRTLLGRGVCPHRQERASARASGCASRRLICPKPRSCRSSSRRRSPWCCEPRLAIDATRGQRPQLQRGRRERGDKLFEIADRPAADSSLGRPSDIHRSDSRVSS